MNSILIISFTKFERDNIQTILQHNFSDINLYFAENEEQGLAILKKKLVEIIIIEGQKNNISDWEFSNKNGSNYLAESVKIILIADYSIDKKSFNETVFNRDVSILFKPYKQLELINNIKLLSKLHRIENELKTKKINEQIIEDERINKIFSDSPDGIALVSNRGIIEKNNKRLAEFLELPDNEIIGENIIKILHKNILPITVSSIVDFMEEDVWIYSFSSKDNSRFFQAKIVQEENNRGYVFSIRDKTLLRDISQESKVNKKYCQQLFEQTGNSIFYIDFQMGKIVKANSSASRLTGLSRDEIISSPITKIFSDSFIEIEETLKKIVNSGISKFFNSRTIFNSKESEKYCDIYISYFEIEQRKMIQVICTDVSKQKKMEEEFQITEERFLIFMDKLPACVYIKNNDGQLIYANKYLKKRFLSDDWIGKKIDYYLPQEKISEILIEDRKIKKGGIHRKEERVKDIYGKDYIFSHTKFLLNKYASYDVIGGIALDITDLKRANDKVNVMYQIANSILYSDNILSFYKDIRAIINPFVDSTNFFIAIYNEEDDTLQIPFEADEEDQFSILRRANTPSWRVFDSGKSVLLNEDDITDALQIGDIDVVGEISKSWMGVCLIHENKKIGMMAVQNYHQSNYYSKADLVFFEKIGSEISLAIIHNNFSSQIKKDLRMKEFLLQEVHHRVNNSFQIISSLLKLQSNQLQNVECNKIIKTTKDRLKAMSLMHEKLYRAKDLANIDIKDYLYTIIRNLKSSYVEESRNIIIDFDVDKLCLNINLAIPCGLIINEIISNSFKFAFPDHKGLIYIKFSKIENSRYEMIIADNGIGIEDEMLYHNKKGMGLVLINSLKQQINGIMKVENTNGTRYNIKFENRLYKSFSKINR